MVEIERMREQEIRILKQKADIILSKDKNQENSVPAFSKMPLEVFKTEANGLISELTKVYRDFSEKNRKPENERIKNRDLISQLKKDNEDLNKRLNEFQMREIGKS